MDITLKDGTKLDSTIFKVMQGVRYAERDPSQDEWNQTGDGGNSIGAYQWNKNGRSWQNSAKQILGDENAPMTPENQNKVAYTQMKALKDAGHTPEEIAALWNGATKDKTTGKYTYLNPEYGDKFRNAIKNNLNASDLTTNPGAKAVPQGLHQIATGQGEGGVLGGIEKTIGGTADWLTRPFEDVAAIPMQGLIAGANALGAHIKDPYINQGMPGFTGNQVLNPVTTGQGLIGKLKSAGQVGTDVALASGAGSLVKLAQGANLLASPAVETAMSKFNMPMSEFNTLSNAEKYNAITEAVKGASAGDQMVLQKAASQLQPLAAKELGLTPNLVQKIIGLGGSLVKGGIKLAAGSIIPITEFEMLQKLFGK